MTVAGSIADDATRSRAAGHFGLVALRGLVTDAGGSMDVRSMTAAWNDAATSRCRCDTFEW